MNTTYLSIILILIGVSIGINTASAEKSQIMLTPFDISFSEKNFTKSGPLHQILILQPHETTTISITVNNTDTVPHEVLFSIPDPQNISDFVDSYSFEPSTVTIPPNSMQQVLLHIKTKEKTDTHWGIVHILAQDKNFGMIGKYFYLVMGDKNNTGVDLSFVDHSFREDLPGAAFPDLYNDYRSKPSTLQEFFDSITANKFGVPRYLPTGYAFQGLSRDVFVYSPVPVTSSTDSATFWRSGGMIVLYQNNGPNFDLSSWMPAYVAENEGQEIMVNGMLGVATEQEERMTSEGFKYKFPAQIQFFKKYASVELRGNIHLNELLKVAASIPQPDTDDLPLVIKQVELYGPTLSKNDTSLCQGTGTVTGSQWFDLYNPTNKTIRIQGYNLDVRTNHGGGGGTMSGIEEMTLGPHNNCIFVLWAVGQAFIADPRDVVISFAYDYDGNKYVTSTPFLTDTYNDTRIWQLDANTWSFVAPSPLEQTRSGISPEYVICNNDSKLVINVHINRPSCIKPSHVVRLESLGWLEGQRPEYIPVLDRTYDSGPGFGCPFIFPHIIISNSSGFEAYNYSGIIHYVLKPGTLGIISYDIRGTSYGLDPPIYSPQKTEIKNGVDIYFQPDLRHKIKQDVSSPVTVLFEPQSEVIDYNGSSNVVAKIYADYNVTKGTYWLNFIPGGCSEIPPIPIVVGNKIDATDGNN